MTTSDIFSRFFRALLIAICFILPLVVLLTTLLTMGGVAQAKAVRVGLVTDTGGINDNGFNQLSYDGMLQAENELGVIGKYYESQNPGDYAVNLTQCVDDGNDLCIAVGFLTSQAISEAAVLYPGKMFAIIDFGFESYPDNLQGITFDVREPAYLAGVLASSMSDSKVLGIIGGMDIPPVTDFMRPFENGVMGVTPFATTLITYTNNFGDMELGAATAQAMMAEGADVIFSPAGPTGLGAVMTATQSGAWGIGVDLDWYSSSFGNGSVPGADKLLTSVLKKLDVAVFQVIGEVVEGRFTAGTVVHNMQSGGVGLALYHGTDSVIPDYVKNQVTLAQELLMAGKLDVENPNWLNYYYMPLVVR